MLSVCVLLFKRKHRLKCIKTQTGRVVLNVKPLIFKLLTFARAYTLKIFKLFYALRKNSNGGFFLAFQNRLKNGAIQQ